MEINCPKCDSNKIFKRIAVPRVKTHRTRFVNGISREV